MNDKNNIQKDLIYFDDAVNKFFNKAVKCDMKGIVNDIRLLESLTGRGDLGISITKIGVFKSVKI